MRQLGSPQLILAACAAALACPAAAAPVDRPSLRDTFRLGTGEGTLCQLQASAIDPAIVDMFDRAYTIVCRDAATPIGRIYALRQAAQDPVERVAAQRGDRATCQSPGQSTIEGLGAVARSECKLSGGDIDYRVYSVAKGRNVYIGEGLAGYDSAIQLALRSVVADRRVEGMISVATTDVSDPAAFARVQAGTLDIDQALAEGYRRNNSGSYAEAAEFFDTLLQRAQSGALPRSQLGEFIVNRALQKSNLGDFAEADALFAQAAAIPTADPVQLRLRRNFLAMHLINQGKLADAETELNRPLAPVGSMDRVTAAVIDMDAAAEINSTSMISRQIGVTQNASLSPQEKASILDAQALQLKGTVWRLRGNRDEARAALTQALANLMAIREGRVTSITRLRAQTMAELSAVAEVERNYPEAERLLREGLTLLQTEYPESAAVSASKARLAAYLSRRGQIDASLALYREVVTAVSANGGSITGFENLMAPYFALLVRQMPSRPALVNDLFLVAQTLVRPGVADTQAILARELSGGSDEAAGLFRQSVNLTRDIERTRIEIARLAMVQSPSGSDQSALSAARARLTAIEADQVATQAKLGQFPRYRALSTQAMTLSDLQGTLRTGEGYYKMAILGNAIYAIYATSADATAFRVPMTADALSIKVDQIRDTVTKEDENTGERFTEPFNLDLSRELYLALFGPIDARVQGVNHLIFEPDGAMLRLPINLFVTQQAGIDAYKVRTSRANADLFDFRGVAWLGAQHDISTAVSARAFRDVRQATRSAATSQYLGLGQNAPVSPFVQLTSARSVASSGGVDCNWPLEAWSQPIPATELYTARSVIGASRSEVITGAAFSDTALLSRTDLNHYRILHFATHGLVTAPRPQCPAFPALLTSFGGAQSDGLLTFREIYDMRLDADLVILSACDTAGRASVAATREAGVTSGGGSALDGLVRAFIGAGGRSVVASHWPVPNDFNATERLIAGLFQAPPGTSVAHALREAEVKLQTQAETSHPWYWSGFAIIGDGAQPVINAN